MQTMIKEWRLMYCVIDYMLQSIGAVNCAIRRPNDGTLYGCNTDYVGAISAIEDSLRGFFHYFLLEVIIWAVGPKPCLFSLIKVSYHISRVTFYPF